MKNGRKKQTRSRTNMTLAAAYNHCRQINQSHYENFPVASKLMPRKIRPAIDAIYAFARTADDFADEVEHEGQRLVRLQEWEALLDDDNSQHPIFVALHDSIATHQIPKDLLRKLLVAYRMDVAQNRHATYADLLHYCEFSANPVGRLVLWLFGYRDETIFKSSDHICTALQLTNFWQDVAVDLKKNRIYLPVADMQKFGVTEQALQAHECSEGFQKLLQQQIAKTMDLFSAGKALGAHLSGRLKLEIGLTRKAGIAILHKIEKQNYDVLNSRPTLSKMDFGWLFLKTLVGGGF